MNRQSRIILCRLSFITFCLTPTLAVATWILWPDAASNWEATLSSQLEVDVAIETTRLRRLGTTRLNQVEFSDPETGHTIAHLEQAELTTNEQGTVFLVSKARVPVRQLGRLYEILHQRSLRRWRSGGESLSIRIHQLELVDERQGTANSTTPAQLLRDVTCKIDVMDSGPVAKIWFSPGDQPATKPVELRIARHRVAGSEASTRLFLQTNGNSIPCQMLSSRMPALKTLGGQCHFAGMIWVEHSPSDVRGEIDGRLLNVDLDRLVSQQFPHQLQGVGRIELKDVVIQNGRLRKGTGSLHCEQGVVSASLLDAAATHLRLSAKTLAFDSTTAFRNLHCGFNLDQHVLTLHGRNDHQGTIMVDDRAAPLLVQPNPMGDRDVLDVVRMLVPDSNVQVPMTEATASMMEVFPLPAGHVRRR